MTNSFHIHDKGQFQHYAPMQCLGHTYTQRLFILYLKFRFNWASCVELASLSSRCSTALEAPIIPSPYQSFVSTYKCELSK